MNSKKMRAGSICNTDLVTADEKDNIVKIAKIMRTDGIGDVVVTTRQGDSDVPTGIVTDRDIVVHAIAFEVAMNELTAGDLVHRPLATVDCDADIFDIARAFNLNGVRRLIVTRGEEIMGIVTLDDVLLGLNQVMGHITASVGRQIRDEINTYSGKTAA